MMRVTLLALSLAVLLAACNRSPSAESGHDHGHGHEHEHGHDHDAESQSATFRAGHGLLLADATREALGVTTAEVEERSLAPALRLTATVFDATPPARASALVPPGIADEIERHPPAEPRLLAVNRSTSPALTQVELVFAVSGSPALGTTLDLRLSAPEREATVVPRSAVLPTATGPLVYVVNGAYLLATPVQTGAGDGDFIEITDGLYAGDVVATSAVEHLRLTELRLTKGGGHSH